MIRQLTGRLLILVTAFVSTGAAASVVATVDRTIISDVDVVTLRIRASDEAADADLDFSPIERDFEILNTSTSRNSSMSIINGRTTSVVYQDHELLLRPKRRGNLVIPSIRAGRDASESITIRVHEQSQAQRQQMNQFVFFETEVDTNETYVQGQIIYSVRLFYTEAIGGDFPQAPAIEDAVVETIENERRYESIVGGRRYYVLEKRYAIFPQRSGELVIPPERFIGTRGRGGIFSQRQRVNAVSESHAITVRTVPTEFSGDQWIPARNLTIAEQWAESPPVFRVGEPVNRLLTTTASGLSHTLLPQPGELDIQDAKVYADPPVTENRVTPEGITAVQVTTIGIVPTREGQLTLPEIRIPWWNTEADREEVAIIPASTFEVLPASGDVAVAPTTTASAPGVSVPAAASVSDPGYWRWAAIGLGLLCILTTWQWLMLRRRVNVLASASSMHRQTVVRESPDEKQEFQQLSEACRKNRAADTHRQLFLWARSRDPGISSVNDLVRQYPALGEEVSRLESHLYSAAEPGSWRGADLLAQVTEIRTRKLQPAAKTALTSTLNPA